MIGEFLNQQVTMMQLVTTSGRKKALDTVGSAWGQIQNIDTRESRVTQGLASKSFWAWFDIDTPITEGMILRNRRDGRRYKVIGVEMQGAGMGLETEHLEVTMVKYNN